MGCTTLNIIVFLYWTPISVCIKIKSITILNFEFHSAPVPFQTITFSQLFFVHCYRRTLNCTPHWLALRGGLHGLGNPVRLVTGICTVYPLTGGGTGARVKRSRAERPSRWCDEVELFTFITCAIFWLHNHNIFIDF
jgi:hypothetical protein